MAASWETDRDDHRVEVQQDETVSRKEEAGGKKKKEKRWPTEASNGRVRACSTFRVSPEAFPRDASGFRAWNLPRSIRTEWISCTLRGITEYMGEGE